MTAKRIFLASVLAVVTLVLVTGCGGKKGGTVKNLIRVFPTAHIPEVIADNTEETNAFIVEHYWDGFAYDGHHYRCDTSYIAGVPARDVMLEYGRYMNRFMYYPLAEKKSSLRQMYKVSSELKLADTTSIFFDSLVVWTARFLYDPNSPYRDEDAYGAFAACLAEFEGYSPEQRSIYEYEASLCSLNERGTQAADFVFRDAKGVDRHLYDIKADYTILFFSNPGCTACKEIIDQIAGRTEDPIPGSVVLDFDPLIASGKVAILNIYIDEDLQSWRDYMPIYSENWYNGYDPNFVIRGETLYNVRAIPSVYLLESDKTVIYKDAAIEAVIATIADRLGIKEENTVR